MKLTDAAKGILSEDSKSTFTANIAAKMAQRGGEKAPHGEVGKDSLHGDSAYGTKEVGKIGVRVTKPDDNAPNPTLGVPSATPPGATPPVGAQGDGVGASKPQGQPQETMGRSDLTHTQMQDVGDDDYKQRAGRVASKLAPQMFQANPGATFQSYAEDIDAMLSGENLSEEFKEKAATIFEAAVLARAEPVIAEAEAALMEEFESAVEQIKEDLATKVDDYLNYMVEEWIKENEIAITSGLKSEIVEDFITGLKGLFEKHYIDIPDDKVDVVEELTAKVSELEETLNEEINSSVQLKKELNEHKKFEAIYTACEGLTQTQVEKMKSLAEGVEFTTEEEFVEKLETIKESYFKSTVKTADASALDDEVQIEEEAKKPSVSADPLIEQVAKTITQSQKNW